MKMEKEIKVRVIAEANRARRGEAYSAAAETAISLSSSHSSALCIKAE